MEVTIVCIRYSVGRKGKNDKNDVKTIQLLLNLNMASFPKANRLKVDGLMGKNTITLIELFQQNTLEFSKPDGLISVKGKTLQGLQKRIPKGFTKDKLCGIMINAPIGKIEKYYSPLSIKMPAYDINTPLRQAHFLAQVTHESGSLRYSEEIASGEDYEDRIDLGNTQKGDGVKFKGRGLIQLTGRANYTEYGKAISKDLTNGLMYKKLADEADFAVDVSCWFWKKRKLNYYADQDSIRSVTKRINGGLNGLGDREMHLRRAKFFLIPSSQGLK